MIKTCSGKEMNAVVIEMTSIVAIFYCSVLCIVILFIVVVVV